MKVCFNLLRSKCNINKSVIQLIILIVIFASPIEAQFDVSGFADTYHAVRIKSPNDFLSSRNRLRLEAYSDFDNTHLFVSFNAMHNYVLSDQTGIELREAYFDYASDNWDLRIGRQIVVWGKADGLQITDLVSPFDYTEFLARDYDDIRIPVDAIKFRSLNDDFDIELIWLPIFQKGILPGLKSPWAFPSPGLSNVSNLKFRDLEFPKKSFANSEFGGRILLYLPGVDMSFSSFHYWNDFPVIESEELNDTLTVSQKFYRSTFIGADLSYPVDDFVIRSETALYLNKRFSSLDPNPSSVKSNSISLLVGVDWYPGNDWNLSVQLADEIIFNHNKFYTSEKHTWLCTFNISKSLLRNTVKISSFAYLGLEETNIFNRTSIDYSLTDEFHLLSGIDIFVGDKGMFGQFSDNSEIWIKSRYNF